MNNIRQIFLVLFIATSMSAFYFFREQNNIRSNNTSFADLEFSETHPVAPKSPNVISIDDYKSKKELTQSNATPQPADFAQENHSKKSADNLSELNRKIEIFFKEIPLKDSITSLNDENLHGTPEQVKLAASMLGEMREIFESRPWPQNIEFEFYLKCSQEKHFFTAVKALCAARVSKIYYHKTGRLISNDIFDSRTAELKDQL